MKRNIAFTHPYHNPRESLYIQEALSSGYVAGDGPFTKRASTLLQHEMEGADILLTTSCTHALEMTALLLGLGPGDEVVMPSYTFSSTANAFALRGSTIRFADVDLTTFTMELPQLEAALTEHTRAVVLVHYGGVSRDIEAITELCKSRNIALVEDNAHGLFATFKGKPMGTFGSLSTLSFHGTKNISCGEGGALVINDPSFLHQALMIREKGTNRTRFLRGEVDKYTWNVTGSSYLPSDILAALLTAQLENAPHTQQQRHTIWKTYRELLSPHAEELGFTLQHIPEDLQHPAHLFALLLANPEDRAPLFQALKQHGIKATSHYEPLHSAPAHKGHERLPATDSLAARLVRLPLHANLTKDDAIHVAQILIQLLQHKRDKQ